VYGKDKAKFSLVSGILKQLLESALLHYGFYAWSWNVSGQMIGQFGYGYSFVYVQISQSVIFIFVVYLCSTLPTLPLSIYSTFVLEEKHGFNKTTPGLFVADMIKGWGLGVAIGTPFIAAFSYVFQWAGDRFVPWLMAFM